MCVSLKEETRKRAPAHTNVQHLCGAAVAVCPTIATSQGHHGGCWHPPQGCKRGKPRVAGPNSYNTRTSTHRAHLGVQLWPAARAPRLCMQYTVLPNAHTRTHTHPPTPTHTPARARTHTHTLVYFAFAPSFTARCFFLLFLHYS